MGRGFPLAMWSTLAMLLLPVASAGGCVSEMELVVGVGTTRFDMEQVFDGEDAADLRSLVDTGAGDDDGDVDPTEVAAWESAMSRPGDAPLTPCLGLLFGLGVGVTQGGSPPHTIQGLAAAMDLGGATRITEEEPVVLRFAATMHHDTTGDEPEVVVTPEGFEGLSELLECMAPDRIEMNFAQNPCGDAGDDPLDSMRRLEIRPADDARIVGDSVRPAVARSAFDGTAIVMTDLVADDTLTDIRLQVVEVETDETPVPWIAGVALGLGGLGALLVSRLERARFRFWWFLSFVGFTRIRREKVLEHRRRELILAAIESEPGVHLGALQRGLDIATGSLVHHLRVLEDAGLVASRRRSNRVHFVPAAYRGPVEPARSELQERLLSVVRTHPGLSQSELAERLGAPRNTIAYNVRRLMEDGRLKVQREGRVARHFAEDHDLSGR